MKPFLIIAGEDYYPQWSTKDWIKTYKTLEEAQNQVKEIPNRFGRVDKENSYLINKINEKQRAVN
jgi:uncharacterized membrane protein (DUF106 family)